jgi:four helix bundle protein
VLGSGFSFWVRGFWVRWQAPCTVRRMPGFRRPEKFDVWKLAWELKKRVYAFTSTLPASKDRNFCDDIRRAARSGPDNVAEGFYRYNPKEFHRFLNDAKASLGEVRNQLLHATDEKHISDQEFREMLQLADRSIGAATNLQKYLRTCPSKFERPASRKTRANPEPTSANPEPASANPEPTSSNPEPQNPEQNPAPQNPNPRTPA